MKSQQPAASEVPIRDAASVILLREGAQGPETFALTRTKTMAFAAGATVFPGGGLDPSDEFPAHLAHDGPSTEVLRAAFDSDDDAFHQRLLVSAVREVFEEAGVLLGVEPHAKLPTAAAQEIARKALESHELSLRKFFTDNGLQPNFSGLHPTARWLTPEGRPRRYDTRFFLAALPEGQHARHISTEAVASEWIRPATLLDRYAQGKTHLMAPTRALLGALSDFSSLNEALSALPNDAVKDPTAAHLVAGR